MTYPAGIRLNSPRLPEVLICTVRPCIACSLGLTDVDRTVLGETDQVARTTHRTTWLGPRCGPSHGSVVVRLLVARRAVSVYRFQISRPTRIRDPGPSHRDHLCRASP